LFGVPLGVLVVSFVAATGATGAYLISKHALGGIVESRLATRMQDFRAQVSARRVRGDLFFYVFALRVTPLLPNWFINLASPHVGVPLTTFWLGTLCGVGKQAPVSLIACERIGL
jgi:uncharacterized membrane protein YdjX (TVP38/TMEM64 family)